MHVYMLLCIWYSKHIRTCLSIVPCILALFRSRAMRRHGELGSTRMLPKRLLSLTATTTLWTRLESYCSSGIYTTAQLCILGVGFVIVVVVV